MFNQKTVTTFLMLALIVPAGLPFALAQTSLRDAAPDAPYPNELPAEADALCADREAFCGGVEAAVREVPDIHVDPADPDHTVEDVRHTVLDHAVAEGVCAEVPEACVEPEGPDAAMTVGILRPESDDAFREGDDVTVEWHAELALDPRLLFYKAQYKTTTSDWTDLPAHRCTPDPTSDTMAGVCETTFTPVAGIYAFRVFSPARAEFCDVQVNCDMVTNVAVDGEDPVVWSVEIAPEDLTDGKINKVSPLVRAEVTDDAQVSSVELSAKTPGREAVTCDAVVVAGVWECRLLDITPLLPEPAYPGVYQGTITLKALALDRVENDGDMSEAADVDTSGPGLIRIDPVGSAPAIVENGARVSLTYKASYVLPLHRSGQPATGEFTVADATGALCTGAVGANGVFACQATGTGVSRVLTASIAPAETADVATHAAEVVWTHLDVARVLDEDSPRTSLHANPSEAYAVAYRVTALWDGVEHPISGAIVTLAAAEGAGGTDTTDADGLVRVAVSRAATEVVAFASDATYQLLGANGPGETVTWTTLVAPALSVDDAFVNVGDTITFAIATDGAVATYEHDADQLVESATLAIDPAFESDCVVDGGVLDGVVAGTITCAEVVDDDIPVVVTDSTRGITTLFATVEIPAVWTNVVVTGAVLDDAVVNVGDEVTLTALATYAHDGSNVPSATLAFGDDASGDCDGAGTVVDGALSFVATCDAVSAAEGTSLPLVLSAGADDVTQLAESLALDAVWTRVVVTATAVDDDFVNVGDDVTLTATATYAHDGSNVPDGTLAFGEGASTDCALLSGAVVDGALTAVADCAAVSGASGTSLPLVVSSATDDVTHLAEALSLDAVWTNVVLADVAVDDGFVNVGDDVTLSATATYAHDGSAVPAATLAFGEGASEDCAGSGAVVDGALGFTSACSVASAANGTSIPVVVASAADDVTQLAAPVSLDAIWTRVVVTGCANDDMVDVGATVTLACDVAWEHDGEPVPAGTFAAAADPAEGCTSPGGDVADGALTATVTCAQRTNLMGENAVAFVVDSTPEGVTSLVGEVVLASRWAEVEFVSLSQPDGHHHVTDEVELSFVAEYVFGATEADRLPASGAEVLVSLEGSENATVTTDGAGMASHTFTRGETTDVVPDLALVTSPEGVALFVTADYGRQVWTEVALAAASADEFVNLGETITYAFTAKYAHDADENGELDDLVGGLSLSFVDAADVEIATCELPTGAGDCVLSLAAPYHDGVTVFVTASEHGITRQLLDTPLVLDPVWSSVAVSACSVDDDFVNVGDIVTLSCTANYTHDESPVTSATLAFGEGADAACALVDGTIVDGALTAQLRCDDVRDLSASGLPLVVASGDGDVTQLAEPVTAFATWTEVVVTYTTNKEEYNLAPNTPVRFTTTVRFAHNDELVQRAIVRVTSGDGQSFVCITGGAHGGVTGQCTVSPSKVSGAHAFGVSATSTTVVAGRATPDITLMSETPPVTEYRWTSIGFAAFTCRVADGESHECGSQTYEPYTFVTVTAKAVASDTGEALPGATVEVNGAEMTADVNGEVSVEITDIVDGTQSVTARGVSADFEGETVTWTIPRTVDIHFVTP